MKNCENKIGKKWMNELENELIDGWINELKEDKSCEEQNEKKRKVMMIKHINKWGN